MGRLAQNLSQHLIGVTAVTFKCVPFRDDVAELL
jgi:hypothetical protein